MQTLELKIRPPIVALLVGVAMWVGAHSHLLPAVDLGKWRLMLARVCTGLGLIVSISGVWALRRAKTTVSPVAPEKASSVVSSGIYSCTRNPMYVGLTVVLVGWAIRLSVPWVLLGPVAFVLYMTRFQIIPEERVMNSKFGRTYDDYRQRVRRWL